MDTLLELKNVGLTYYTLNDEISAVKDLSFKCKKYDFISIIGPSGCGKTSILSLISGLIKPTEGEIVFANNKNANIKDSLGYMLQKDHLFPWRTIEKNVYLPLEINKKCTNENKNYAINLLKKYNLSDFINKYPSQLSGGMRQRVALIRTLASKPELLLLDEPFSALDSQTRLSVCNDVYNIIKAEKKTAILVTHDIAEAISMSDIIIILTNRPAKVKTILEPKFKNDNPLKRREDAEFSKWFEIIWKELTNEKTI